MCLNGSANNVVSFFGSIHKMFIHEAWVGGPELCVLELDWYTNAGRAEVSGNPLVEKLPIVRTISADRYNLVQTRVFCIAGCASSATATKYQWQYGPTIRLGSSMKTILSATVSK